MLKVLVVLQVLVLESVTQKQESSDGGNDGFSRGVGTVKVAGEQHVSIHVQHACQQTHRALMPLLRLAGAEPLGRLL